MRSQARPFSVLLLVAGSLAPRVASAQAAPAQQYPAQPAYQQPAYPQQPGYAQPAYPQEPGYAQPPQAYPQPQQAYPQQSQPYPQQPQPAPQPPQAYPQPQPQPYPQYPQAPQAYPPEYQQPQPYPQPYPPPATPPPGYYAPPPAYTPPPVIRPRHRGLLLLPYLGFNSAVGDGSDAYSAGFRLGSLLGFFAGPFVSLNAELSIDILNPDTDSGASVSSTLANFSFSPLAHFGPPNVDFVIGPRFGFYGRSYTTTVSYSGVTQEAKYSDTGFAYGFNIGAFVSLGSVWLGGLLSLTTHKPSQYCETSSRTNNRELCSDVSDASSFELFTLNGALLF